MSTRAVYTFSDQDGSFNVYKHSDGYPSYAAIAIELALEYAWQLPRFEADDFAAAFVAANKSYWHSEELRQLRAGVKPEPLNRNYIGGGVRLLESGKPIDVAPPDIEYRYEITFEKGKLYVKAFSTEYWDDPRKETSIFYGTFAQFKSSFTSVRWNKRIKLVLRLKESP